MKSLPGPGDSAAWPSYITPRDPRWRGYEEDDDEDTEEESDLEEDEDE